MDYLIVYLEVLILTLTYTVILFLSVRREMGNDWEVKIFRTFLSTLIVALIADAFTQAQYRGFLHMPPMLVAFLYAFYMSMFSGVLPFLWFIFVEMRLGSRLVRKRSSIVICMIPLLIMVFMCYASMKTGWFFSVDEYGIYTRGKLWSLQAIVNYCYFAFTTVHAFLVASKEPSSIQRHQYYILASFVIAPFIGGLFQLFIGNHPFVAPATSIAMLFIFLNIQGSLIHNDSLTGLMNRKSAERHIEEIKLHTSPSNPYYVFKMGVDGFKAINDEYGYIEGDKLLKTVAKVLQNVSTQFGAFVSRLGGVEFLAVVDGKNLIDPEDYEITVKDAMEREAKNQNLPYELKLDFGYTKVDSPAGKTSAIITEADHQMHSNKNSN